MNRLILTLMLLPTTFLVYSQDLSIQKVEPPNWWTGMKHDSIQLMFYGKNLGNVSISTPDAKFKVLEVHKTENSNYLFVDVKIAKDATPGNYKIILNKGGEKIKWEYPILKREDNSNSFKGFGPDDVVYLITPDRFANGDLTNDNSPELFDKLARGDDYGRHGGDIQGIVDHLDYIKELGVTSIWINPLLENNTKVSYHGYACTDLYKIDPRFGTNELYKTLVGKAHNTGLKVIIDHVNNHIGINHNWVNNPPMHNWFNGEAYNHFLTTHHKKSMTDIHSSELILRENTDGWFVDEMPDLNQRNNYVAKYLIQNTIWWIEFSGIDGIREDTYPYSDQKFLSEWVSEIFSVYPDFNIVGEIWIEEAAYLAPYQKGNLYKRDFDTNLPSMTDFCLSNAIREMIIDKVGISSLYDVLSKDHLYTNPNYLLTFTDNHDMERLVYILQGDVAHFKMILTFLLTTRGIPQIYYGTEIGLTGGQGHGALREDFPGGFPGDTLSAFTRKGRTAKQNELFDFSKSLLEMRKKYQALSLGKLIHYPPKDEVYFYFRIYNNQKILVILNNGETKQKIGLPQEEFLKNVKSLINLLTNKKIDSREIEIDSLGSSVYLVQE
ncbi:MAG: hypothetical protein A2057_15105 [Ignavibacteria bacterium GWA2_35_9]|nr:MAG: hypothetical protein A2057_15105 [Ignavibacteria bacterium GWA2_35_9]OGU52757.1 MAG: hypothetical protein A2080_15790 [Ignavibacteria bacterium GWC2_36_12]